MGRDGVPLCEIASKVNISVWRAKQIFMREKAKEEWTRRCLNLQRDCRESNNIDREMPIDDLFCMLACPTQIRTVLGWHLNEKGIKKYSIRDIMEFLIPKGRSAKALNYVMPAYGISGMGKIRYATLIKLMSSADCGEEFQREWNGRKIRLKKYLTRTVKERQVLLSLLEDPKDSFLVSFNRKVQ